MASNSDLEQIYIPLVDEPVPMWRPVFARRIAEDEYFIVPQEKSEDEEWEFDIGSKVIVEIRGEGEEAYIAAVRSA